MFVSIIAPGNRYLLEMYSKHYLLEFLSVAYQISSYDLIHTIRMDE